MTSVSGFTVQLVSMSLTLDMNGADIQSVAAKVLHVSFTERKTCLKLLRLFCKSLTR